MDWRDWWSQKLVLIQHKDSDMYKDSLKPVLLGSDSFLFIFLSTLLYSLYIYFNIIFLQTYDFLHYS